MKKSLYALMTSMLLLVSCADKAKEISTEEWEAENIGAYIQLTYPNEAEAISRAVLPSGEGGYMILCPQRSGEKPRIGDYVRFYLTGKLLDGSIFKVTRRQDAEMLMYKTSTFYSRHFVPVFDSLGSANIPAGLAETLRMMSEGDSAVIILPSHRAYGDATYSESGYSAGVAANSPVIFEVVLREIISGNRMEYERKVVDDYVDSINKTYSSLEPKFVEIYDTTLKQNLQGIYVRYIDTADVTDSTPLPQNDTVLALKYAGYYLDGFWLDTNIDTIARRYLKGAYKLQSTYLTTYSHTMGSTSSITAFNTALARLNKGSKIEFVFTSEYGYGSAGYNNVPPYTPLRFWVYRP